MVTRRRSARFSSARISVAATRQVELDDYSQVQRAPKETPTTLLALGADGTLGRDALVRFLEGGRTSLEVGLGATLVALLIALPIGAAAGYFGGFVDAAVARFTDTLMAFPLLLFLVFATSDRDRDEHPARGEPQLHRRRRAAVDADVWLDALDGVGDNLLEPQRRADDLVVVLLAVPLGAFTGTRVGALSDRAIMTITLIGICTHPMVLGNVLVQIFGCQGLRWDLDYGYCPLLRGPGGMCGGVRDWSSHLILPWATFALLYLALYTRMIRASVSDTLHEEFVRAARAKGASELRVVVRHVLPAVSLRVLTMVGMEIGTAIGICIYIEKVFGLHGIASYAVDAMGRAATDIDLPFTLARDADHADRHDREPRRGRPLRGRRPRAAWGRRRRQSKSVVGGVF